MSALTLKYRPKKISQLDLKTVRESLSQILKAKDAPQAFLFVGPKGTGKTSAARIVAKSINCTGKKGSGFEPCNKCQMCQMIDEGRSMDLLEIDAASNRGIDDIRDLREKIKLSPSQAKVKVYIIDEVHMLTTEAFNALLKTLEEPPKHAGFVLCTTEPHKLPETIISRCLRIDFQKAEVEEIIRSLKRVVKGEGLKIGEKDLKKIAQRADGSFRDAVKVLDQLSVTSKRISSKKVKELLDRGYDQKGIDKWLMLIKDRQTEKALTWLSDSIKSGAKAYDLSVRALERLRQIWLNKVMGREKAGQLQLSEETIKALIKVFDKVCRQTRGAVIESLPLEIALVEWGEIEKEKDGQSHKKIEKEVTETVETRSIDQKAGKLTIRTVEQKWQTVLQTLRLKNHGLEALLKATRPKGFDQGFLLLEVFYKFHKERLETDRYRKLVEEAVSQVMTMPVRIRYFLSQKGRQRELEDKEDKLTEEADNISVKVEEDIIKTAEEIFGVEVD